MAHITETLHHDHDKVSELLEQLKGTTRGAGKTRAVLCQQIRHELLAHTEFEEKVFYPAVREAGDEARDQVEKALGEHEEVDAMLEELERMEIDSDEFMSAVSRLQQAVMDHVHREEEKIFPLAKGALDAGAADEMSERHDEMVEGHMRRAIR